MLSPEDFFKGKSIFITGGSGFIGKVLIEKLLRSYDSIEKIYLLLRENRNKSIEERLKVVTESQLFEKLRKTNPEALNKLIPICGDMSKLKLGLSENDIQTITENVDVIYHGAATVRFDDHLKDSVILNTRGTRELINIALQSKKSITFLHISTAYCNSDQKCIEEKLYPAHADWRSTIQLAEEANDNELSALTLKYINPLPNTYTFSKSLSEHVVNDLCKGKLSTAIVRPTIVVSTYREPYPGFVDNFNGPVGLSIAQGKGIMRVMNANKNASLNCVPVDLFVKLLISITYERSLSKDLDNIPIYNAGTSNTASILVEDIREIGEKITWDAPYTQLLWYPSFSIVNNWFIKIYRKIYVGNMALAYFLLNSWTIVNDKCVTLIKKMGERGFEDVAFDNTLLSEGFCKEELIAFFLNAKIKCSKVLLKEDFNREKGFRNTLILWIMSYLLQFTFYGLLVWYFIVKFKTFSIFTNLGNIYFI